MATALEPAPVKKKGLNKIVVLVVCAICTAAGTAVPWLVYGSPFHGKADAARGRSEAGAKTVIVPFGEVIVNLHEERMTRYLRVKIVLTVDAAQEKAVIEHLGNYRAQLKNWLIGHLAGKSLKDVGGSVGVKRLQREILEHIDEVLYPDGDGPIREVLFEEYAVQ